MSPTMLLDAFFVNLAQVELIWSSHFAAVCRRMASSCFVFFCAIYKRHSVNTEPAKNLFSRLFFAAGAAVGS